MYSFKYHSVSSTEEACTLFESSESAVYLSGGMTLIPTLKQRLDYPTDVIDLGAIDDLQGIDTENGSVRVGSRTCHADVACNPHIQALADLAGGIGDLQVRNCGTIGGSIANNDPAADYPAALLGLGATVHTNNRDIRADEFFLDLFETALHTGEIVTAVSFPTPLRAAYVKFPNPASRYAIVGVFVAEHNTGIRVAVTGAGSCVFRATAIEEVLQRDFRPAVVEGVSVDHSKFNSDIHASQEFRGHLVTEMTKRAVAKIA
ncbi:MAG: xanthine dehydrogenase family protein subunit M [Gammaproteobacteria bacterium]|nr:xanthine dehydrogenase family protein subunit M [Gammaproteobacteria bacterium]